VRGIFKSQKGVMFINLGKAFPNNPFSAVIFPSGQSNFYYNPQDSLKGLNICINGEVKVFKGKAEIIVNHPSQISLSKAQ